MFNKSAHTYLKTLDVKERVQHIATMIGGDPPSKSALDNAKELLASQCITSLILSFYKIL